MNRVSFFGSEMFGKQLVSDFQMVSEEVETLVEADYHMCVVASVRRSGNLCLRRGDFLKLFICRCSALCSNVFLIFF